MVVHCLVHVSEVCKRERHDRVLLVGKCHQTHVTLTQTHRGERRDTVVVEADRSGRSSVAIVKGNIYHGPDECRAKRNRKTLV